MSERHLESPSSISPQITWPSGVLTQDQLSNIAVSTTEGHFPQRLSTLVSNYQKQEVAAVERVYTDEVAHSTRGLPSFSDQLRIAGLKQLVNDVHRYDFREWAQKSRKKDPSQIDYLTRRMGMTYQTSPDDPYIEGYREGLKRYEDIYTQALQAGAISDAKRFKERNSVRKSVLQLLHPGKVKIL